MTQVAAQVARKRQANAMIYLYTGEDVAAFGGEPGKELFAKIEKHVAPLVWEPPEDGIRTADLLDWVDGANVPLVIEYGPSNFNRIGNKGRELVVGIVDGDDADEVIKMKTMLADYATNGPKAIVSQYYFGWLDGKQWYKFLEQFEMDPDVLPQFLVLEVPSKVYYRDVDYKTVSSFLEGIDNGSILSQDHVSRRGFMGKVYKLEHWFFSHLPYSLIVLVTVAISMLVYLIPSGKELRPPYPEYKEVMERLEREKAEAAAAAAAAKEQSNGATTAGNEGKKDK